MIQRTLRHIWSKKFTILVLALVLILLPNTIGHSLQVLSTTVVTKMEITKTEQGLHVTAEKFQPTAGADQISYETITWDGSDIRALLADTSLAHCTELRFTGEPDLQILHDLYHYRDLRGNTKVNNDKTINELLKDYDAQVH